MLDNGPIHIGRATTAALTERARWLTVEGLPRYAPERDDGGRTRHDLKAHRPAHRTFADPDARDAAIHKAADALAEPNTHPPATRKIPARDTAMA